MTNPYRQDRDNNRQRWRADEDERVAGQYSGVEEDRHWREDNRRNPYDHARNASPDRSWERGYARNEDWRAHEPRSSRGGYQAPDFGGWDRGRASGGAVGGSLYGGYDRHGAGRGVSQSDYGAAGDYGYGGQDRTRGGYGAYEGPSRRNASYGRHEYEDEGYAPGSQIWNNARRDHDYEADYLHWREQQMRGFDDDYSAWRSERRQKFSSDFDSWRQNRPRTEAKTPAENPIVGDVSDGGTGDISRKKN